MKLEVLSRIFHCSYLRNYDILGMIHGTRVAVNYILFNLLQEAFFKMLIVHRNSFKPAPLLDEFRSSRNPLFGSGSVFLPTGPYSGGSRKKYLGGLAPHHLGG